MKTRNASAVNKPWRPLPEQARVLYQRLSASFTPFDAAGEGLTLWRYLGGPWERLADVAFEAET